MAKNAHLTLDERATIEVSLREGKSFTEIGRTLGNDPSTISKEVKNHRQTVRKGSYNPCANRVKGACEVTHEMILHVLPKGTSFDALVQDNITLLMSHINSYNRKKLNNQSSHQLFSFLNGRELLEKLNIKLISANEINLTPLLLKK